MVLDHVEAFNQHDRRRLLAGLAPDAVWNTGRDTFVGHAALAELFDDDLWLLGPSLGVQNLVCDGSVVAAQFIEALTVEGVRQSFAIAGFFVIRAGLIQSVKIYREGSADVGPDDRHDRHPVR